MITYTPSDILEVGEEPRTVECHYCCKDIYLDYEDVTTELIHTYDCYYHADCAEAAAKWVNLVVYLTVKNEWQEFFEWLYDCKFDEFSEAVKQNLRFAFEKLNGETDRNYTAFKYVEDNIEDYLVWYEEE